MRLNAQTWESLSFIHWRVPAAEVRALLPAGLEVDEYDGETWLGVVPFVMAEVRVPPLPALAGWSRFPELNLRVYVRDRAGNRGVWFLGLWCTSPVFVAAARSLGLPYRRARASVAIEPGPAGARRYRFEQGASFRATVRAGEPVTADAGLAAFLTARWSMFAMRGGRLWRYPVTHEPWTLRTGALDELDTDLADRFGLPGPAAAPLVHVADPVHALAGPPRRAGRPALLPKDAVGG